jgi:hypothetical protein
MSEHIRARSFVFPMSVILAEKKLLFSMIGTDTFHLERL